MQENYSSTMLPTVASTFGGGGKGGSPASPWSNPSAITVDDSTSASWGAFESGQGASITGSAFNFPALPGAAVIDGIKVSIEGWQSGSYGSVMLNIPGAVSKDIGALNGDFGSIADTWGVTGITPAQIAALEVTVDANDVSGGDAIAEIEHMKVTVYWHIMPEGSPADVPTRIEYKVFSRSGKYLGALPNPRSKLSFPQDINSAGSLLDITCAKDLRNITEVEPLLTEDDFELETEDGRTIFAESTELLVTTGASPDDALFKNSNIIQAWLFNYWHPNGKLMFTGQVNRISFTYGASSDFVNLKVYSLGHDLSNYIARGFPFTYSDDQVQTSQDGYVTNIQYMSGGKSSGWDQYGQTANIGAGVTNIGAIDLMLQGTANVKLRIYDQPNGNLIGSVDKSVAAASATVVTFELPSLLEVTPGQQIFFVPWTENGQSIRVYRTTADPYANGSMFRSQYSGGSGGGSFGSVAGDFYFKIKSGTPTTTTTYSSQDPISSTMDKILLDYNNRGGMVTKRDFEPAGFNVTYKFNMSTIFDAMKKMIEISPRGFYSYIDLGSSEMDIKQVGAVADFTVVKGRDLNSLDISLTIEQVKNYLLFTGGETSPGVNLYRDYTDSASASAYGLRTVTQSDNRVTVTETADALGESFIDEYSEEEHETQITVMDRDMDITLLTPGKTIGFANFGNFIDDLVLQIVRREYSPEAVTLTLGRLPITLSAEVQQIQRDLLNEQTKNNPSSPS